MPCLTPRYVRSTACAALLLSAAACFSATAESMSMQPPRAEPVDLQSDALGEDRFSLGAMDGEREIHFRIRSGFEHQFRTNIDGGGRFSSSRFAASIGLLTPITHDVNVRPLFAYEFADYSFRGDTGIGGPSPWSDIHTFGFGVLFEMNMTNEWMLMAGPVFQFSAESSADFSDGFIGGGVVGTSFELSPDLTIGGGVGIVTQIERGVRVFPIILLDWQITDQLKLTSRTASNAFGDTSLELVYDIGGGLEVAAGGTYRFRRFRLDSGGIADKGVGQDTSIPFWGRLTYHFNPHFSVNLYGGVVVAGELQLMDTDGNRIGKEDYDPAGFLGVSGSLRF